jgi:hypothetical protein
MKPTREELDYERKFGFLTREEVIPPDVMKWDWLDWWLWGNSIRLMSLDCRGALVGSLTPDLIHFEKLRHSSGYLSKRPDRARRWNLTKSEGWVNPTALHWLVVFLLVLISEWGWIFSQGGKSAHHWDDAWSTWIDNSVGFHMTEDS